MTAPRSYAAAALYGFGLEFPASDSASEPEGCPVGDPDCEASDDGAWHCHDACEPPDAPPFNIWDRIE